VVAVPAGLALPASPSAEFYWRDLPPNTPAFFTPAPATLAPNAGSVTAAVPGAPGVTGRAAVIFDLAEITSRGADACAGLSSCTSTVQGVLGPVEVVVDPGNP
jgi:hypothetical protein